jgi:hypothetical protein
LRPQRKESTPAEMLMDSIRGCSARTSLRKTKGPPVKSLSKYKKIYTLMLIGLGYNSNPRKSSIKKIFTITYYSGVLLGYETSRCEEDEFDNEENNKDDRRKVTLDPSLVQNMLNFSDDESDEETTSPRCLII